MKNILITGGAGYIGSHVTEFLIKKKYKITIIDNLSTGYKFLINKKSKFYNGDINNVQLIKKIIKNEKIDSVIHLAANLSVSESVMKPMKYYINNVLGTLSILKCLKGSTVKNFIFASTCAVYKDRLKNVNEKSNLNPTSVYGHSKLIAEDIIKLYAQKNKINYGILRFFNVVGASKTGKIGQVTKGDQLFKNISLELMKKKPVIKIYGNNYNTKDKTCIRDYIHVSDLAEIHFMILKKISSTNKSYILNCGYAQGISVAQVVNEFVNQTRKNVKIITLKRRKGDMEKIIAQNSLIKKLLLWKPKYSDLKSMVQSCIIWENKLDKLKKIS